MARVALCAALAIVGLLLTSTSAAAEPISFAIGLTALLSSAGFGAAAGAIGGAIVSTAIGVGLSVVAGLLTKSPSEEGAGGPSEEKGVQLGISIGGDVPRSAIYGTQATAGQFVYFNTFGTNNEFLQLVYVLSDGPCDSLTGLEIDGKPCTLGAASGYGLIVNEFVDAGQHWLWVNFHNGDLGQAADPHLVANSNPAGRWTDNDTLANLSYVMCTLRYNETLFTGGIPSFLFTLRGLRLYDWRKDSTNGGSGAHRWGQPATYEWSDNPAVGLYNYQRGLWAGPELVIGQGVSSLDLVLNAYTAAANACDESVPTLAAPPEPRYRIGMQVSNGRQYREVIQDFLTAMAGTMTESAGAFAPHAGVVQLTAQSFTDNQLVSGYPVRYAGKRSRAELVNAIFGTYSDPSQGWRSIAFPPRTSSADETFDGGERLAGNRNYPMVFSATQAQRIGEIERRLARRQATATVTLPFEFVVVEPGDWVNWTSTRFTGTSSSTRAFQVANATVAEDRTVTLQLREIAPEVFSWSPAIDQLDPQHPGDLPGTGLEITTIAGLTVSDVTVIGASGTRTPGLRCQWVPVTDHRVYAVVFQYRIQGSLDTHEAISNQPSFGEYIITEAIQPSSIYEVRATIRSEPPRVTTFTAWIVETAPAEQTVLNALASSAAGSINWESFENDIRVQLEEAVSNVATVHELGSAVLNKWLKWKERADMLHGEVQVVEATAGDSFARITHEETVRADADIVLAQQVTTLEVSIDDNAAAILSEQTARATADEAIATEIGVLTAIVDDNTAAIVNESVARSTADGAIASDIEALTTTVGDNTAELDIVATSVDGIEVKFGVTGTINGATGGFLFTGTQKLGGGAIFGVEINGNLLVNGTITGSKIAALAIDTAQLNARAVNANIIAINGVSLENLIQGAATAQVTATHAAPSGSIVGTAFDLVSATLDIQTGVAEVFYQNDGISAQPNSVGVIRMYMDGGLRKSYSFLANIPGVCSTVIAGIAPGVHSFLIQAIAGGSAPAVPMGAGYVRVTELRR